MAGEKKAGGKMTLVIRKNIIVEGGGHHGGAWKVAYADFVTAMMAFFLLMWLLNATTEAQRRGIADYFSPANLLSQSSSGSGKPFGGLTPTENAAMVSDTGVVQVTQGTHPSSPTEDNDSEQTATRAARQQDGSADPVTQDGAQSATQPGTDSGAQAGGQPKEVGAGQADKARDRATAMNNLGQTYIATLTQSDGHTPTNAAGGKISDTKFQAEQERREKQAFQQAAQQIRAAIQSDPQLADLSRQLAIDMTPEGLRIQIMDEEKRPMFATGSAVMNDRAQLLLQKVAPVLMKLPENISISGHTDAAPFPGPGRTNWDLSADRANATRRLLMDAGLPEARIRSVTGNAERDPLFPADPLAPANRRIAIVVLHSNPVAAAAPAAVAAPLAAPPVARPMLAPAAPPLPMVAPPPVVTPPPPAPLPLPLAPPATPPVAVFRP